MDEILFLNFGNVSNYVNTHFWNLNDEIFKLENQFNLDQQKIYDGESNLPLTLIYDFSENIHPYRLKNTKTINEAKDESILKSKDVKLTSFIPSQHPQSNSFIKMLNDEYEDEENKKNNQYSNNMENETEITKQDLYKLQDDELFEFMDFENSIRNWNDFCQPIFARKSLNEIKTIDLDINSRNNYFQGQILYNSYNYNEDFEDNFRYFVEKCGKLSILNFNIDFNSCWGGIGNKMFEHISNELPKSLCVLNGFDANFEFENEEKILNYLFYFSDILNEKSTTLFQTNLINENKFFIESLFNYKFNSDKLPVYLFYLSSVLGANQQNLYIPYRSLDHINRNYFNNLIISNSLNFFDCDSIFPLNISTMIQGKTNSGVMMNFNRRLEPNFSWNEYLLKRPVKNICIINGFNEKYLILQQKIDLFLIEHSKYNFVNVESFKIPLCFPKNYYIDNKKYFINDLHFMNNFKSNFDMKDIIKSVSKYVQLNKIKLKVYLSKITQNINEDLFEEINSRMELLHNLVEEYNDLSHFYKLTNTSHIEDDQDN